MPFFALLVVGALLAGAALVTGRLWLLAAAAPFLVVCGIASLVDRAAWHRLTSAALARDIYTPDYRERVRSSDGLRRFTSALLVVIGAGWLVIGLLL